MSNDKPRTAREVVHAAIRAAVGHGASHHLPTCAFRPLGDPPGCIILCDELTVAVERDRAALEAENAALRRRLDAGHGDITAIRVETLRSERDKLEAENAALGAEVDRLNAFINGNEDVLAVRAEVAALRRKLEAFNGDGPYPVTECLRILADNAEHALRDHDCDAHGWEVVQSAMTAARVHLAGLTSDGKEGTAALVVDERTADELDRLRGERDRFRDETAALRRKLDEATAVLGCIDLSGCNFGVTCDAAAAMAPDDTTAALPCWRCRGRAFMASIEQRPASADRYGCACNGVGCGCPCHHLAGLTSGGKGAGEMAPPRLTNHDALQAFEAIRAVTRVGEAAHGIATLAVQQIRAHGGDGVPAPASPDESATQKCKPSCGKSRVDGWLFCTPECSRAGRPLNPTGEP